MAEHDVVDGTETFERLGVICDRIAHARHPKIAEALAGHVRERRGRVRAATSIPFALGRHLTQLADEAEHLAWILDGKAER